MYIDCISVCICLIPRNKKNSVNASYPLYIMQI